MRLGPPLQLCSPVLPRRPPAPAGSGSLSVAAARRSGRAPLPFSPRGNPEPGHPPPLSLLFPSCLHIGYKVRQLPPRPHPVSTLLLRHTTFPQARPCEALLRSLPCSCPNPTAGGPLSTLKSESLWPPSAPPGEELPVAPFSQTLGCLTFPSSSPGCRSTPPSPSTPELRRHLGTPPPARCHASTKNLHQQGLAW
jgi:hypothetical protein